MQNQFVNISGNNHIKVESGRLIVPDCPVIPYIEGDGIGPEIWKAASQVFDEAVKKAYSGKRKLQWLEVFAGEKAFNKFNCWLPDETIDLLREYIVAIKGPLTTPIGGGIRSLNVTLRQTLDLYVCLRPVKFYGGLLTPTRAPEKVDMVIFRENTEDIYTGIEFEAATEENKKFLDFMEKEFPDKFAKIRFGNIGKVNEFLKLAGREEENELQLGIGVKVISKTGSERLMTAAIDYAIKNGRTKITIVHKGNIMKYTSGSFMNWAYEVAEKLYGGRVFTMNRYNLILKTSGKPSADEAKEKEMSDGKIFINDIIADNALQQVLIAPHDFDVIASENLNGDYLSDAIAAQIGGIGMAPGANINYVTGSAIFEATHGTAPAFAGLDKANPSSLILSGKMMLEYLGWNEAAELIENGLQKTIMKKFVTSDLANQLVDSSVVKCSEFGKLIIENFYE